MSDVKKLLYIIIENGKASHKVVLKLEKLFTIAFTNHENYGITVKCERENNVGKYNPKFQVNSRSGSRCLLTI